MNLAEKMSKVRPSRRRLLKGVGATAVMGAIGMPAILRAADQVKIGFMAPMTGDEALLGADPASVLSARNRRSQRVWRHWRTANSVHRRG
jgi:hypothetical protein